MRIAYVYDAVYPWATGGVERRVWELARRLAADHDVHLYGLHYWDGDRRVERDGVTLHGVCRPPELYVNGRRSVPEALLFAARLVGPLLADEGFDVVDCQEFPYFPALAVKAHAVARDATFLLTWHEVWGDYWYDYLGRPGALGKLVERGVARLPEAHLAVSNRTAADVRGLGVDEVGVTPNGVSLPTVDSVAPADSAVDVLSVGRLVDEKNVDAVVRAMAERPSRRCLVVGDGPERERLEALADRLDAPVAFTGFFQDHETVLSLMKRANVLVHPSLREGFGMTVLEALACGTPVVTSDHPRNAAAELVEEGATGYVVAPTASAIAEALPKASALDPSDCEAAAEPYDWDRIVDRLEATYAEVA